MRSNMTDSAQKDDSACTDSAASMVLSTRELESTEGRVRWADTLDSTYCEMDVDWPDRHARFAAELTVRPFGDLTVSVVHADPHTVVRTPEMIRSDPNDDYLLCLIIRGTATLQQHSRSATLDREHSVSSTRPHPSSWTAGRNSSRSSCVHPANY